MVANKHRKSKSRGQALVEFALVIPIFLLVLFAIVDVARFVYMGTTLSNAAREAARLGAVEAGWLPPAIPDSACNTANGPVCPADVPTLRTHITAAANREMAPFGSVTNVYTSCNASTATAPTGNWTSTTCATSATGSLLSVRVTSNWRALTPIISSILNNVPLSGSATMVTH